MQSFSNTIRRFFAVILLAGLCNISTAKTIYVDDDATSDNDGSSWENAYIYLQDALADANDSVKTVEIRVARGVYKPDQGTNQTSGDRMAAFQLINGVTLAGGYAGIDANDPNVRDIKLYETILSGDLNDDDCSDLANNDENSYHVATVNGTNDTAVIEGFTVTAGNANGLYCDGNGGGICNYDSSLIITNCTFSSNSANYGGGGMYNNEGSPTLTNCMFTKNSAFFGGGMFNEYSDPNMTNCILSENFANASGGGMCNFYESSPNLTNCIFSNNFAEYGGGMDNFDNSNPTLTGCTFTDNIGFDNGGGMDNSFSIPILADCKFSGNYATSGGGMFNRNSSPVLTNCIFSGNVVDMKGGGMWNYNESNPTLTNCTFSYNSVHSAGCDSRRPVSNTGGGICNDSVCVPVMINCILWGNTPDQIDGSANVSYSNIESGWPEGGKGNTDVDPCFADPGYWVDVNDPNVIVEPNDPNAFWIDGDYHLKSQAGRVDPNSQSWPCTVSGAGWIIDNVTSPCIDAGDPNSPVAYEPYPNGTIINMGAYGGTAEASMSPSGLHAKYGHGTGEQNNPYFIYTVEHLNTLGNEPNDYDKHFKLMADVNLAEYEYNMAVIASDIGGDGYTYSGNPFTGIFDGNGREISNLTITGQSYLGLFGKLCAGGIVKNLGVVDANIIGSYYAIGGLIGDNDQGIVISSYSSGIVTGYNFVGGLVGYNNYGNIALCYSSCSANGTSSGNQGIGGLVGVTAGNITTSYSTGDVSGERKIGGLVGRNYQSNITNCYSTGMVSGNNDIGGLVGVSNDGITTASFWDMETSGLATSAGGTGKTTAEMKTESTFTDAGWDFIVETENGDEDIWWIDEGVDYPHLWWEMIHGN